MREIYFGAVLFKLASSEGNFIFKILADYDLYPIFVIMKGSGCNLFPKKNLKFSKSRSSRAEAAFRRNIPSYEKKSRSRR